MGLPQWVTNPIDWSTENTPSWAPPAMPGSLQSFGEGISMNAWSHPYGEGENSMDRAAGGASADNPWARRIGRTVGTAFLPTLGNFFGEEAGAAGAAGESAGPTSSGPTGSTDPELGGQVPGNAPFASNDPEMMGQVPGDSAGASSWFSNLGMPSFSQVGSGLNIGSGLYGLYLARQAQEERKRKLQQQREYQSRLNDLMANPNSVTSLPGYKFRQDQGEQAIMRRMASMGYLNSGNLGVGLTKFGQDYATGELERQQGLLAQLYGMSGPNTSVRDPFDMASRSLASLGYGVGRLQ